ncbi:FadR family transcriptional regulator [Arthrobacter sp. zg-ZUI100]|uniref:FCD domain-containing protein n=1 Tax=Arthrobacter jiangjiafuii TaxID=2817475 RepID=UPI001AEE2D22|nr:FadR family transcriptional regulator [Arthrobacter jiangjiafuii]
MAVTDEAITKIKEMLVSGQLKAGDRLPPENELSDQLGLSRSSLREAVKALELIRVLDVRRGDGTYVTSLEPGLLTETMGFMVEIHQETSAPELLEVRRILEPGAAAHAAGRMDARAVAALRSCLDDADPQGTALELAAHDFAFHSHIGRASGNPYLAGLLDSLTGSALRLRTWQRITEAGAAASVLEEHAAILEALTLGDAELVRSLMTVHVASAERWLRRTPAPRTVPAVPVSLPATVPVQQEQQVQPAPAPEATPEPTPAQTQAPVQPQIARIAREPALYELFAMPSTPGQKAARKPRRPA